MPLRPMLFLLAAVVAELAGVVAMKLAADQETWLSLIFMYAMIGFSFYLLSFVVEEVAMGLAYALWEAAGMTAVTLIGYLAFAEEMNAFKVAGIILLITGVIIVKLGTPDDVGNPERAGQKHA
ncbi:multidrug efflux SMR transporter [Desulfovibrio sp. OttesenSCG-928-C14]|nr:multidrug efflux SMR transporter [Desulfovibrio sp. OttesenSCG-928-C14]